VRSRPDDKTVIGVRFEFGIAQLRDAEIKSLYSGTLAQQLDRYG
jgi:hypothetical protein